MITTVTHVNRVDKEYNIFHNKENIMNNISIKNFPRWDSDDDFERICAILMPNQSIDKEEEDFEPPDVRPEMLSRYQEFLLPKLPAGLQLTGREDLGYFSWEEQFVWGDGNPKNYKAIKKNRASCDDKFLFIKLLEWNERFGLIAEVKRISDKQQFTIPL